MISKGKRILYIRKRVLGLTQVEFGKLLGVSHDTVSSYEKDIHEPPSDVLIKIAKLGSCSVDWLLTGKEVRPQGESPSDRLKRVENELRELQDFVKREFKLRRKPKEEELVPIDIESMKPGIPVIANIPAGHPIEITHDMVIDWIWVPQDALIKKGKPVFGIKIDGDSMSPKLEPGDYVIVIAQEVAKTHDIVVARLNGESLIKEFIKREDHIILRSSNPKYEPIIVLPSDDFKIIGVIYGIGLRKIRR
ncbi:MAG: S24 family peptidase [bacterium]|nr:S24 family peptidase [bacterium]